ncbi:MAG: DUF2252 domain-containing protein, partial [Actinomycetota bacterium]|nr:DUF2252 domain-containing protein [Actinomycetota bacterium]
MPIRTTSAAPSQAAEPPGPAEQAAEPLSPAERAARGKGVRAQLRRSLLGAWEPGGDRPSPVQVLGEQDATRVPELVPLRHSRMLESPFSFYRGGAAIMAADLAQSPRTGLEVQLCGDAHLSNFGVFAAPDRSLVFSVNDFDETLPGPFEWDVKRLAASFAVAGRQREFSEAQRRSVVEIAVKEYRTALREFAAMRDAEVWYARLPVAAIERFDTGGKLRKSDGKQFDKALAKAERKNSLRALSKLTRRENGSTRIISDPPLIVPIEELTGEDDDRIREGLEALLSEYRFSLPADTRHLVSGYRYVHAARKVVGVGSVGTRAWIVLLQGRDDEDPLFLQAKEAQPSVLEPHLRPSRFKNHGRRVVEGQRLMQAASDIFLGWICTDGIDGVSRDFYLRQLWDGKGSA